MPQLRLARLLGSLPMLVTLFACHGKQTESGPEPRTARSSPARPPRPAPPATIDAPDPTPNPAPSITPATPSKPADSGPIDPQWFHPTMFGDNGTVLDNKRTQADAQGRFSRLIRFELTDMTVESCARHLEALVKKEGLTLERKATPEDRIQLTAATDRYTLTFVCGTAAGTTIAYVSLGWM